MGDRRLQAGHPAVAKALTMLWITRTRRRLTTSLIPRWDPLGVVPVRRIVVPVPWVVVPVPRVFVPAPPAFFVPAPRVFFVPVPRVFFVPVPWVVVPVPWVPSPRRCVVNARA